MEPFAPYNTELLVLKKPTETLPEAVDPTAFESFLSVVQELHLRPEVHTNRHSVRWAGHPVINDICSGLYLYGMRVAQDRKMPYHTEDQIARIMMEIDPVIEVGLVSRFASMQEAAEAYLREVTGALYQVVQVHGLRPGMKVPGAALKMLIQNKEPHFFRRALRGQTIPAYGSWDSLWQFVSALFFVQLEASAMEKIARLNERLEKLHQKNWIRYQGRRLPLTSIQVAYARPTGLLSGPLSQNEIVYPSLRNEKSLRAWFQQIDVEMGRFEQRQRHFRELPISLEGMPEDVLAFSPHGRVSCGPDTMAEGWLTTQLLLSCLDDPGVHPYLLADQYLKALLVCQSLAPEQIKQRVLRRLLLLCPALSEGAQEEALFFMERRIQEARTWEYQIDVYTHKRAFISFPYEGLIISHEEALALALGEALDLDISDQVHGKRSRQVQENIFEAITWSEVAFADFERMLTVEILPPIFLARGLARIPEQKRPVFVEAFLQRTEMTDEVFHTLQNEHVLVLTAEIVVVHHAQIPSEDLEKWLRLCAKEKQAVDVKALVLSMLRLSSEQVRDILLNPKDRDFWISSLIVEIWSVRDAERYISHEEYRCFLNLVGTDLWRRMILVLEVVEREVSYREDRVKPEVENYRAPWDRMTIEESGSFDFSEVFELQGEDLLAVITSFTEEELLCWFYEGESPEVISGRLEVYRRNRAEYYAFSLGKTAPPH